MPHSLRDKNSGMPKSLGNFTRGYQNQGRSTEDPENMTAGNRKCGVLIT